MFEFLEGVTVQRIKGDLPLEVSGMLYGVIKLVLQNSNDEVQITMKGGQFTISPNDLPPGFVLASYAPPYEILFEANGDLKVQGNGSYDAMIYRISDAEKFRASLMNLLGSDEILKALGVISTEINNLKPVPAIVKLRGW